MLRVESYLLFFPYDNSQMYPFESEPPGDSLWELGLDFTVSPGKVGFRGAEEHLRLKGRERFKIFGLLVDADGPVDAGDAVMAGDRKVGVVTCPCYSKLTGKSMAIVRLGVEYAKQGTKLRVEGKNVKAGAIAHTITFDDPEKKKRNAVG
jgi:aminomethyltransferase